MEALRQLLLVESAEIKRIYAAYSGIETEHPPRLMSRKDFLTLCFECNLMPGEVSLCLLITIMSHVTTDEGLPDLPSAEEIKRREEVAEKKKRRESLPKKDKEGVSKKDGKAKGRRLSLKDDLCSLQVLLLMH